MHMRSVKVKLEIDNLILIRIDVKISFSHTMYLKYNFYRNINLFKFNVDFFLLEDKIIHE